MCLSPGPAFEPVATVTNARHFCETLNFFPTASLDLPGNSELAPGSCSSTSQRSEPLSRVTACDRCVENSETCSSWESNREKTIVKHVCTGWLIQGQ